LQKEQNNSDDGYPDHDFFELIHYRRSFPKRVKQMANEVVITNPDNRDTPF